MQKLVDTYNTALTTTDGTTTYNTPQKREALKWPYNGTTRGKTCNDKTIGYYGQGAGSAISKVVGWVIQFAPFGIMGLVFSSVGEYGLEIFVDYGMLLLVLVGCMIFTFLVVNPIIVGVCLKKNPYPLVFKCFKEYIISNLISYFIKNYSPFSIYI
jgi:Na+/serine symporter